MRTKVIEYLSPPSKLRNFA